MTRRLSRGGRDVGARDAAHAAAAASRFRLGVGFHLRNTAVARCTVAQPLRPLGRLHDLFSIHHVVANAAYATCSFARFLRGLADALEAALPTLL